MKKIIIVLMALACMGVVNAVYLCEYQETANEISQTGIWTTGYYAYDGIWDIFSGLPFPTSSMYINYTKPIWASNLSTWQVMYDQPPYENISISLGQCWNYDPNKIILKINNTGDYMTYRCYNGEWIVLLNWFKSSSVHEEAIWWNATQNFIYTYKAYSTDGTKVLTYKLESSEPIGRKWVKFVKQVGKVFWGMFG
jgi:hypothetical protein